MKYPTDKCLLCKENNSSQRNSHIIPKFFGQGIFSGTKPRHGISWSKDKGKKKVQDISKENYLFCPDCEKGFSVSEAYCAIRLERYNNIRYYNKFNRIIIH